MPDLAIGPSRIGLQRGRHVRTPLRICLGAALTR